jgi:hypothetical protein
LSVIRNWELYIDVDMVLRAQGADPGAVRARGSAALGIAEKAIGIASGLLTPAVSSATLAVAEFRHQQLSLVGGGHLTGPLIAEHFRAAKSVVVALCTIGPALEAVAAGCFADDPALSVALDAVGSAAVDLLATAMCQRVDEQAEADGVRTTIPLSPGLVGWPLASGQRQLFALVDAATLGVILTESSLMMPQKSTSLAIGIGPDVEHSGEACDYCSMSATCRYRQDHIAHGA